MPIIMSFCLYFRFYCGGSVIVLPSIKVPLPIRIITTYSFMKRRGWCFPEKNMIKSS